MPDPALDIPLDITLLRREIGKRVLEISGDQIIKANKNGDMVCLSISIDALLPYIPKPSISEDVGELQYQVKQMVSDNQAGWDYVRAHPLP